MLEHTCTNILGIVPAYGVSISVNWVLIQHCYLNMPVTGHRYHLVDQGMVYESETNGMDNVISKIGDMFMAVHAKLEKRGGLDAVSIMEPWMIRRPKPAFRNGQLVGVVRAVSYHSRSCPPPILLHTAAAVRKVAGGKIGPEDMIKVMGKEIDGLDSLDRTESRCLAAATALLGKQEHHF